MKYNDENDRFECPEGHLLHRSPTSTQGNIRYGFKDRPCTNCKMRDSCPLRPRLKREKAIVVSQYHQVMRRVADQEKTEHFVEKLRERMWKIEGLFAEGKSNHCLDLAKCHGRAKVQIQAYCIGITQNLKRLLAAVSAFLRNMIFWWVASRKTQKIATTA